MYIISLLTTMLQLSQQQPNCTKTGEEHPEEIICPDLDNSMMVYAYLKKNRVFLVFHILSFVLFLVAVVSAILYFYKFLPICDDQIEQFHIASKEMEKKAEISIAVLIISFILSLFCVVVCFWFFIFDECIKSNQFLWFLLSPALLAFLCFIYVLCLHLQRKKKITDYGFYDEL